MKIDNNKLVSLLRKVVDPQSGNDIITMKLIKDLKIEDNNISFSVNTAGLPDTSKFQLHEKIQEVIGSEYPDANVNIHFVNEKQAVTVLSQVKNIIAVASGKGGVGKSTVAVNIALGLMAKGAKVGLMDADLYGPSIPTMLHIQDKKPLIHELYGKHRIEPIEQYGLYTISIGNIVEAEQAVVLRGPRLGGIIKQFINEVIWPELDYLIIDLPPGTGDIQLSLVQTVPVTGAIIVTTPQDVAVSDAIKAMNMFRLESINVPIVGIVENMAWFTPDDAPDKKYLIFGEGGGQRLAKMAKSVLLGQVPLITKVRESGDQGVPIVLQEDHPAKDIYLKIAEKTMQQVNIRNEAMEPSRIVGINVR